MALPRSREEWKSAILHQLWVKVSVAVLMTCCGYILAQGKSVIRHDAQAMIMDTVRPSLDSLRAKVDTLAKQEAQSQAIQREFFGAMMEVVPGLKKAVQDRGKQNDAVEVKKAETETLLRNLTKPK